MTPPDEPNGTVGDLVDQLASRSPSQRMRAAQALRKPLSDEQKRQVLVYIQGEVVPQIRGLLEALLAESTGSSSRASTEGEAERDDHASGDDLTKLIVHELAPAIGLVALEASVVIPDYENSPTALAIDRLTRRVRGVAKIVSARPERIERVSVNLLEAVQFAIAGERLAVLEVTPEDTPEESFVVQTDPDVLGLLLEAALNNASEAQAQVDASVPITVEVNASQVSCAITITNRFSGESFDKEQIIAMGRSTRFGGRGTGMRVVVGGASSLDLDWDFRAVAGVATCVVRFAR